MNITASLTDALKQVVQTLQVRHLFPAAMLIVGMLYIFWGGLPNSIPSSFKTLRILFTHRLFNSNA